MRSLAVGYSLMYFRAVGLSDPIHCVFKHGTGHAFKFLGWLCPAAFIFLPFETPIVPANRDTLIFLRPETRDVATRVSGRK